MNRLRARRRILTLALLAACTTVAVSAVEPATADDRTRAEITALLTSFLSPEQNPTRAAHESFWADDLVYTSSAGKVTNKAEILASFDEPPKREPAKPAEPEPVYSAEDSLVRPYGEMAALTFRLVARAADILRAASRHQAARPAANPLDAGVIRVIRRQQPVG